jgi:hypothetical protein
MIIEIILKWAIPFVLSGFAAFIVRALRDTKALKRGMLAIIRSQIVSKCEKYRKEEYLPEYARYCLEDLYKQYKQLGGNHGIDILVEETFKLPPVRK